MFTGIIEAIGTVRATRRKGAGLSITVESSSISANLLPGESVSVSGACLTVTRITAGLSFSADVVPETLERTNLALVKPGDKVNLERSLRLGDRLSGHIVLGHVDGVGEVTQIARTGLGQTVRIRTAEELMRYVAAKGSVAVDGASLTVAAALRGEFEVALIPHTLKCTVSGRYKIGTRVNIEVDVVARYLESLLGGKREARRQGVTTGLTADFLKEKW